MKTNDKLDSATSENLTPILIIACMGTWVVARCILDALRADYLSMAVGVAFSFVLLLKALKFAGNDGIRFDQFLLIPSTLLWATWTAHHGVELYPWWLPSVAIVAIFSPFVLAPPLLTISIMLISSMLLLQEASLENYWMIASVTVISLIVLLFRRQKKMFEMKFISQVSNLQLAIDAGHILYVEVDSTCRVLGGSPSLINRSNSAGKSTPLQLHDLVHAGDHALMKRALHDALDSDEDSIKASAACDCRLVFPSDGSSWVHAQFVRKQSSDRGLVVAFSNIDDRLRIEAALRESQRKLASQSIELSSQFEATKLALHARQEMERMAQHDLRSPLRSIQATVSLLKKSRILSTREDHLLMSIEQTANRALSMVTMSLDLYRMEEGTFHFVPENIDLVAIGRNAVSEFGHHARSKNVHLEFNASIGNLKVIGNFLLISSIVENLVRNAIEAAPEHSTVTVGLYQGVRAGLLIHNEGEVDPSIRSDFFEKYSTHGKRGGLGLGTYSARLSARAQGGDLTMTSSAEKGTLLLLKLKRSAFETSEGALADESLNSFGPSLPGHLIQLPYSDDVSTFQTSMDLLVVEDDDHNWLILLSWLPKHVNARRAINGREAIEALIVKKPDLVVMDLEMPIMGGFETIRRIREMQTSAGEEASLIYAFTGYDDKETKRKIRDAGFDGVLSKPVQQGEFEDILKTVTNSHIFETSRSELWIEKSFMNAFPTFVDSRLELIDNIEQSARAGDSNGVRHAAHTLSGSPAIHGFERGVWICHRIMTMANHGDLNGLDDLVVELRRLFYKPAIR